MSGSHHLLYDSVARGGSKYPNQDHETARVINEGIVFENERDVASRDVQEAEPFNEVRKLWAFAQWL